MTNNNKNKMMMKILLILIPVYSYRKLKIIIIEQLFKFISLEILNFNQIKKRHIQFYLNSYET